MHTPAVGCRDDRGETLIEFAFAATLFLTIIFGTIEFGLAVWQYNIVSDLAQEGARWASVRGNSTGAVQNASTSEVRDYVRSRAVGLSVNVVTTPDPLLGPPDTVTVQVSTQFTPLTTLIPHATMTLTSSATMTHSR
jgi:Flp pilus assembly protein TadG